MIFIVMAMVMHVLRRARSSVEGVVVGVVVAVEIAKVNAAENPNLLDLQFPIVIVQLPSCHPNATSASFLIFESFSPLYCTVFAGTSQSSLAAYSWSMLILCNAEPSAYSHAPWQAASSRTVAWSTRK